MDKLLEKLREVASKAEEYKKRNVLEPATKAGLIEPLFREIGWNFSDIDSVEPEFPVQLDGENNPADYAFKVEKKPHLFIEAKRINSDIKAAIKDGTEKALRKGIPWLIATNGDIVALLRIEQKIPDQERLVFRIALSDSLTDDLKLTQTAENLRLLTPENVASGQLRTFANDQLKRTRITNTLEGLFRSKDFLKLAEETYEKIYQGDPIELDLLREILETVHIDAENEPVGPVGPSVPDEKSIRERQSLLFKHSEKKHREIIKDHIVDRADLWRTFIETKRMSTKQFKDVSHFKPKATGTFCTVLRFYGLAKNVGYDKVRKGSIWEINDEVIPDLKKLLETQ